MTVPWAEEEVCDVDGADRGIGAVGGGDDPGIESPVSYHE